MRNNPLARSLRPPRPPISHAAMRADTLPAPTKGWNVRDPLALMDRGYAVTIDNYRALPTHCEFRGGSDSWATGMTGTVESLMAWVGGTSEVLVAAANSKLWNVTTAGAAVDITGATAPQSNRWQHLNMGGYLLMFDGATVPQKFNGTVVTDAVYTGSGLTPANLISPTIFKERLYIVEKGTLKFWYGAVANVTGALLAVDLATVFREGGEIMGCFSWSREGAVTSLDCMCFISSVGEILVYSGSYPGDWGLIARLSGAPPIGRRFWQRIGQDVAIITINGVTSLSKLAASNTAQDPEIYLSNKISPVFGESAKAYKANFGWQILLYPQGTEIIVNIPIAPASSVHQYVQYTQTGAWYRWKGWNAACFELLNDNLYYGGASGVVYKADTGADDNGAAIVTDMLFAYDYFKQRQNKKRFLNARPIINSNKSVVFAADMQVDFRDLPITDLVTQTVTGTPWGSPWGSPWSLLGTTFQDAIGISGVGYAGALRLRASTIGVLSKVIAVGVTFEAGNWL